MKDAEIMRQNARFRSSWEPGGDLITLTVRVAGATVVNGVIGHCHDDGIAGFRRLTSLICCTINLKVKHGGSRNSTPLRYSMVLSLIPDSGKSGMGMGMDPRSPANRGSGMGMIPDCRRVPSSCTEWVAE